MLKMPSITLCMIVKNEQELLPKCLSSIAPIVDEMIIVDTGSSDKTMEIAKKYGARVFNCKWADDFSKARNESIKRAAKEWILVLDADETISKQDLPRIKSLIKDGQYIGIALVQRTYSNKQSKLKWVSSKGDNYEESRGFAGWAYRGITRIFKNDRRIRFEYPVHETVIESIKRIKGKIKKTNIPIHHYSSLKKKEAIKQKDLLYYKLGKKKLKKSKKPKFYFEMALHAEKLKKHKEAAAYFKKAKSG